MIPRAALSASQRRAFRACLRICGIVASILSPIAQTRAADDRLLHTFERHRLTDVYFSEGANAGDVNHDAVPDVVYGPYWFAGPDYSVRHEIYPPVPQDTNRYADNFFNWVYDFNGDGWSDVLVVGFPGTPAYVYENPQAEGLGRHWPKHQVFDWVSNESPQFVDLTGDDRPELVCTRDGYFGYVSVNWDAPFSTWEFHTISEQVTATKFGHGLGVGDVDGDGLSDIIHAQGWFEQPAERAGESRWLPHPVKFSQAYGGADMYAYDVDGDGDNDIITSEAAHDYGLSWYEQVQDGDERVFRQHIVMGTHPSENRYGVLFTELHSVHLADMDGDGLKDIVTGKTYWSHHKQSPLWDAGAVVYWFRLVRGPDGVDWVPYQVDGEAGIGRQLTVADVNADGLPDIVVGGMLGAHVLTHAVRPVSDADWEAAQPKVYAGPKLPSVQNAQPLRGPKAEISDDGRVANGIEAEAVREQVRVTAGRVQVQPMQSFAADRWSGDSQLFWTGAGIGDILTLELPPCPGPVNLDIALTCARDYGIVQLSLDDQPLGDPIDLFDAGVITTGVLSFPGVGAKRDEHTLTVQVLGANRKAVQKYMVGIDWIRITPAGTASE